MVFTPKVVNADQSVRVADIERQPVDDNALIFLFQNKIFNTIQDSDTERAIKCMMLLDAHLEPYKNRWFTKDKEDKKVYIYAERLKTLNDKFKQIALAKGYKDEKSGKFISVSSDDLQFEKAIEWYRLQRLLMGESNILPRGSINVEV